MIATCSAVEIQLRIVKTALCRAARSSSVGASPGLSAKTYFCGGSRGRAPTKIVEEVAAANMRVSEANLARM
jgi:hypothetical protein